MSLLTSSPFSVLWKLSRFKTFNFVPSRPNGAPTARWNIPEISSCEKHGKSQSRPHFATTFANFSRLGLKIRAILASNRGGRKFKGEYVAYWRGREREKKLLKGEGERKSLQNPGWAEGELTDWLSNVWFPGSEFFLRISHWENYSIFSSLFCIHGGLRCALNFVSHCAIFWFRTT